jgi:hypothetical protein
VNLISVVPVSSKAVEHPFQSDVLTHWILHFLHVHNRRRLIATVW